MFPSRHRRRFITTRKPLSDADYISRLNVEPATQALFIAVRRAVARACDIDPNYVYPDDSPASFARMFVGGDPDEIALSLALEGELDAAVPSELPQFFDRRCFWWKQLGARTIGEWSISVAKHITHHGREKKNG